MLSIVDPTANFKIIAKVPSGPDPHEVEASTDGRLAFISNYGGGAYNTITVVDLVGQKVLSTVDLGPLRGPHGLIFSAGKLWFTAEAAKVIEELGISGVSLSNGRTIIVEKTDAGNWQDVSKTLGPVRRHPASSNGGHTRVTAIVPRSTS